MSNVGRFEILSPIFSGALDTSTARDPETGKTVLLHLLPAGRDDAPREFFVQIARDWPGQILDSGFDAAVQRSFIVTEYPKDRKAFRLLINKLSELTVPAAAAASGPKTASIEIVSTALAAGPESRRPAAVPSAAAQAAAELLAVFRAQVAPKNSTLPQKAPPPAPATRMFDPSAVFGSAPAGAAPAAEEKPVPPQDGATRVFDPSAVFGASPAAANASQPATAPPSDSATRLFDPTAVFGAATQASGKPVPPAGPAQDRATRVFNPKSLFGMPAPQSKALAKEENVYDSSKRAAEDFISGRLPAEFRDAPIKVQRSLEELLGRKVAEPDIEPTPGRPGVMTLMFDAYGKRIEQSESAPHSEPSQTSSSKKPGAATKMFSSADLSTYFAEDQPSDAAAPSAQETHDPPHESSSDRK